MLGLSHYKRLPKRLKTSVATFQRIANSILKTRKRVDALDFPDDTLTGIFTREDLLESLISVLEILQEADVRLWMSNCSFGMRKAGILSCTRDGGGLNPLERYAECIWKLMETVSADKFIRLFGFLKFVSGFVEHIAETTAPLCDVLRRTGIAKKKKHRQKLFIPNYKCWWDRLQRRAWNRPKKVLNTTTVLVAPMGGKPEQMIRDAGVCG